MLKKSIKQRTGEAHREVVEVLNRYFVSPSDKCIKGPTAKSVSSITAHKDLTDEDIENGVVAFCLFTKLSGSGGNVNLHNLLKGYLRHPELRNEINALVKRFPKKPELLSATKKDLK